MRQPITRPIPKNVNFIDGCHFICTIPGKFEGLRLRLTRGEQGRWTLWSWTWCEVFAGLWLKNPHQLYVTYAQLEMMVGADNIDRLLLDITKGDIEDADLPE